MIGGLNIVSSRFALRCWVEFKVEAWPIPKRRRRWRVRRIERSEPGCYQAGNTLIMHPDLIEKLKEHTS
jgi:hypothetical protein